MEPSYENLSFSKGGKSSSPSDSSRQDKENIDSNAQSLPKQRQTSGSKPSMALKNFNKATELRNDEGKESGRQSSAREIKPIKEIVD